MVRTLNGWMVGPEAMLRKQVGDLAEAVKPEAEWREVGKNAAGETVYADANGVHSVVEGGNRVSEAVGIRPTRDEATGGIRYVPEIKAAGSKGPRFDVVPEAPRAPPPLPQDLSGLGEPAAVALIRTMLSRGDKIDFTDLARRMGRSEDYVRQVLLVEARKGEPVPAPATAPKPITADSGNFANAFKSQFPNEKPPYFDPRTGLRAGSKAALDFLSGWELAEADRPRSLATSGPMQTGHDAWGWWHEPPPAPKSWAPENKIEGKWGRNAVRFATKEEAEASAADRHSRWTMSEGSVAPPRPMSR